MSFGFVAVGHSSGRDRVAVTQATRSHNRVQDILVSYSIVTSLRAVMVGRVL
ncbi:MAG: hypothetical protein QW688_08235 [Thermoprotei archaeon]